MKRFAGSLMALIFCLTTAASAQQGVFSVDANVALSSLVTIADGHLVTMADTLETLAATDEARSAQWPRIAPALHRVAETQVPAVLFFANTKGDDWTLAGKKTSIADRPYFADVMRGRVSMGTLVVSRSAGRAVAIVAVPIKSAAGAVVGLLGASVYLDELSARVRNEMGIGPSDLFWAINGSGVIAIHSDPTNVLVEPAKMSPVLRTVTQAMLSRDQGTQTYEYRGRARTVIFRRSNVTGWRYGFGVIR